MTTKERHESVGKGQESLVKGLQRAFTTETIADQHDHEINGIVLAKACAGKLHAVLNGFQDASRDQHLSKGGSFCSPGRDRGNGFRVHLDCYGKISHTECVFSLSGNQSITSFPFKETHFFCLPPVSLSSCSVMTSRCASRGSPISKRLATRVNVLTGLMICCEQSNVKSRAASTAIINASQDERFTEPRKLCSSADGDAARG